MRILIQRSLDASVTINGKQVASIDRGVTVLVGIEPSDTREDAEWLAQKLVKLRIFDDENGVMNRDLLEVGGRVLIVSQFTLHASTRKGNRPSYIRAARPETAIPLYEYFIEQVGTLTGEPAQCGQFGADMQVRLTNDGPVTLWIDSKLKE